MNNIENILRNFSKTVENIFGGNLEQIILYGSYARGDFSDNSDIDIMVLTSLTDNDIRKLENQVYDAAYDLELAAGIPISVNIKNADQFNYWLGALPYYDNVKKEGKILAGRQKQST